MKSDIGLTFGRCLRSILRQDPDIVMVGEIRDLETAQIAIQASLTGHLVFTTVHTNDAPSTVARLLDLGLETFLVTATIEGIVAIAFFERQPDHRRVGPGPDFLDQRRADDRHVRRLRHIGRMARRGQRKEKEGQCREKRTAHHNTSD